MIYLPYLASAGCKAAQNSSYTVFAEAGAAANVQSKVLLHTVAYCCILLRSSTASD